MVTRSQAHTKANVDTSEDGPKEECSVQDDQEGGDEFSVVCAKLNMGQNSSQKYGFSVVILKLGIIPLA